MTPDDLDFAARLRVTADETDDAAAARALRTAADKIIALSVQNARHARTADYYARVAGRLDVLARGHTPDEEIGAAWRPTD